MPLLLKPLQFFCLGITEMRSCFAVTIFFSLIQSLKLGGSFAIETTKCFSINIKILKNFCLLSHFTIYHVVYLKQIFLYWHDMFAVWCDQLKRKNIAIFPFRLTWHQANSIHGRKKLDGFFRHSLQTYKYACLQKITGKHQRQE
mgnify:CR=1 FL=1